MKIIAFLIIFLSVVSCQLPGAESDHRTEISVDRILVNGVIWTGTKEPKIVEALAIDGDRIFQIGTTDDITALAAEDTEVINLDGKLVLPGFQDSHIHIAYLQGNAVLLEDVKTLSELQQTILKFAEANPDSEWITGMGWGYSIFPDQKPLAEYIDAVIPDRPVLLASRDGHMALANSKALSIAGITDETENPPNGRIVRNKSGQATGELQESAMQLVREHIPPPTEEEKYLSIIENMNRAAAAGLTTLHETGTSLETISIYERLQSEGKLKARMLLSPRLRRTFEPGAGDQHTRIAENIQVYSEIRDRLDEQFLHLTSIKGMLDGTIDAKTAAMFEPYIGTDDVGLPFWRQEDLNNAVAQYDAAEFQIVLHAIGDKAIHMAVNAFEYARSENGQRDSRHRVEHAEMPRLSDVKRMKELGITASTQPMFAHPDATVLTNFEPLLGPERAPLADNFAIWDDAGVTQVFGSDFPVMTLSVLKGIEVAVTRMTDKGEPAGGWHPEGRISVEQAVRHYTSDAAWGVFDENERGTLSPGKIADLIVLERNIFEIPPQEISETQVLMTLLGGQETWRDASF